MYAIIDKRCSTEIKNNLLKYVDDIFELSSQNITYNSISGHPDIFLFQDGEKLIIAPNSPDDFIQFLESKGIKYSVGITKVDQTLENSSKYNCFSNENYFFYKPSIPDQSIVNYCDGKKEIELPQAYVRCSMFGINESQIVTSDKGIVKSLNKNNIDYFYFDPLEIQINDHKYGFIGGTMGRLNNTVFFLGNMLKHRDGKALHNYITSKNLEINCLGKDLLYDGGGIFFIA